MAELEIDIPAHKKTHKFMLMSFCFLSKKAACSNAAVGWANQNLKTPPETVKISPVTKDEESFAKKKTASATSGP